MRSLRFLCDLCVEGSSCLVRLGRVKERFPDTLVDFSNGALRHGWKRYEKRILIIVIILAAAGLQSGRFTAWVRWRMAAC